MLLVAPVSECLQSFSPSFYLKSFLFFGDKKMVFNKPYNENWRMIFVNSLETAWECLIVLETLCLVLLLYKKGPF